MSRGTRKATQPVKSVRNTVTILEEFKARNGATLTELASDLDQSKSSIHNYLSTLLEQEVLIKKGNEYHVGLRLLELGSATRKNQQIYRVARDEIDRLAEETGELVNLLVEEHGKGVYIYRKRGENAVTVDSYIGQRVYLHNTALGKAILAHMPDDDVESILDRHGLPQETENTTTDKDELLSELDAVAEQGVAFDDEERLNGLRCVAVPILNDQSRVEGAISVSGPTTRMQEERFRHEVPALLKKASNIIELDITHG